MPEAATSAAAALKVVSSTRWSSVVALATIATGVAAALPPSISFSAIRPRCFNAM